MEQLEEIKNYIESIDCSHELYVHGVVGNNVMSLLLPLVQSKFAMYLYAGNEQTWCMHICVQPTKACKCAPHLLHELPVSARKNKRVDPHNVWTPRYRQTIFNFIAAYSHDGGEHFDKAIVKIPSLAIVLSRAKAAALLALLNYPTNADELRRSPCFVRTTAAKIRHIIEQEVPATQPRPEVANPNDDATMAEYIQKLLSDEIPFHSAEEEAFFNPPASRPVDVMYNLLMQLLPVPVDALLLCSEIISSDKFAYIDTKSNEWKRAVAKFTLDIRRMSTPELCKMVRSTPNAYFSPITQYMPIHVSLVWLKQWLHFQFGTNMGEFVGEMWSLLDGATKKNCLWLHGPPNSGKSFVLQTLAASRIVYGTIKNAFSTNNFPFESAVDKKLIFLDEFCFDSRYENTLLELFAGQSFTTNVKYQGPTTIFPTPVVMATNDQVIDIGDERWKSHVRYFPVKCCVQLFTGDTRTRRLHPGCWPALFFEYNLCT